jgi:hypothetical protein
MLAGHSDARVWLTVAAAALAAVIWRRRRIEQNLQAFQFEENPHWWLPRLDLSA